MAGICLNSAFWALSYVGIDPVPLTPFDPEQFGDSMNATKTVESMGFRSGDYYGNIIDAIKTIWNQNIPIIEGFTEFLTNLGVPWFIIELFRIPYRVAIPWALLSLWRGG